MPIRCYSCMKMVEDETSPICPFCKNILTYESKDPADLIAGSALKHRYVIGRALGRGGNGITYIALDNHTNQRCAIKECFPKNACTRGENNPAVRLYSASLKPQMQAALNSFQDEIAMLKLISRTGFAVSYLDSFYENGTCYLVMEYANLTLSRYMELHKGKLPYKEAIPILKGLLHSISELHHFPYPYHDHPSILLHRDISTDNICLYEEEDKEKKKNFGYHIRLIDFGSAAPVRMQQGGTKLRLSRKPGYTAPEQYNNEYQDERSDLYSVGVVLYKMLCGHPPTEADETRITHPLHIEGEIPNVPKWVDQLIEKATMPDPMERFQTAEEFLEAIEAKGKGIQSREDDEEKTSGKGRKAILAAVAVCALAGLIILVPRLLNPNPNANSGADMQAEATERISKIDLFFAQEGKEEYNSGETVEAVASLYDMPEETEVQFQIRRTEDNMPVSVRNGKLTESQDDTREYHCSYTCNEPGDYWVYLLVDEKEQPQRLFFHVNEDDASGTAEEALQPMEISTEPPTEAPTNPPTDPPTEAPTNPPTDPPTAPPTDPPTEAPTNPPTDPPTAPPTDPPTAPPTDPPTAPPTDPPTEAPTNPPTDPPTAPPTDPPTQPPTEPPTVTPTEPPTEIPAEMTQTSETATEPPMEAQQPTGALAEIEPAAEILKGDVNDDGEVNAKDVLLLNRYLESGDIEINLDHADMNDDGKVNLKDQELLTRMVENSEESSETTDLSATDEPTAGSLKGDVNDDGKVNAKDVLVLNQYLESGEGDINQVNADMNDDGKINLKDLNLLTEMVEE